MEPAERAYLYSILYGYSSVSNCLQITPVSGRMASYRRMDGGDGGWKWSPLIRSVKHARNHSGAVCLVLDGIAGMVTLHWCMGWKLFCIMLSVFPD